MTTARTTPQPPDPSARHASVPWDGETNPGFVQPAGDGPLVLTARPCDTSAAQPSPRPITALGALLRPADPVGAGIGLLHLSAYGWVSAGPVLSVRDAVRAGAHGPTVPDLLRGAAA